MRWPMFSLLTVRGGVALLTEKPHSVGDTGTTQDGDSGGSGGSGDSGDSGWAVHGRPLADCPDPSLVVHTSLRRLITPYRGHWGAMSWNADGETLDHRSAQWSTGFGAL
jgi:hypothetical protein